MRRSGVLIGAVFAVSVVVVRSSSDADVSADLVSWRGPFGDSSSFEYSPDHGDSGTVVTASGTCVFGGIPADEATVRLARVVLPGSGLDPFIVFEHYDIDSQGAWAGEFVVPEAAPSGDYSFGLTCRAADQLFGSIDRTFVVENGGPGTSTTTSSTPPPSTTSTTNPGSLDEEEPSSTLPRTG
jgi:hypothetical protein